MVIADELTGSVELCLVCCYVVVALLGVCSWPGGMRHPASTLGARAGAVNRGGDALALLDDV